MHSVDIFFIWFFRIQAERVFRTKQYYNLGFLSLFFSQNWQVPCRYNVTVLIYAWVCGTAYISGVTFLCKIIGNNCLGDMM